MKLADREISSANTNLLYYEYKGFDFKIKLHIPTHREMDIDEVKAKVEAIRGELKAMLDSEV